MTNPAHYVNRPAMPSRIVVEYDCRGGRAVKEFTDAYASRRFYTAKSKAGKNPKITAAER